MWSKGGTKNTELPKPDPKITVLYILGKYTLTAEGLESGMIPVGECGDHKKPVDFFLDILLLFPYV
jgi:hypothetical protein